MFELREELDGVYWTVLDWTGEDVGSGVAADVGAAHVACRELARRHAS